MNAHFLKFDKHQSFVEKKFLPVHFVLLFILPFKRVQMDLWSRANIDRITRVRVDAQFLIKSLTK